ncbi:MAG: hypothetical protein AB8G16_12295 [Gammaproteobacteria bacterium]
MLEQEKTNSAIWLIAVAFAALAYVGFAYGVPYFLGGFDVAQLGGEQNVSKSEAIQKNLSVPFRWVGIFAAFVILLQPLRARGKRK